MDESRVSTQSFKGKKKSCFSDWLSSSAEILGHPRRVQWFARWDILTWPHVATSVFVRDFGIRVQEQETDPASMSFCLPNGKGLYNG
jgi:hypothetical protein